MGKQMSSKKTRELRRDQGAKKLLRVGMGTGVTVGSKL